MLRASRSGSGCSPPARSRPPFSDTDGAKRKNVFVSRGHVLDGDAVPSDFKEGDFFPPVMPGEIDFVRRGRNSGVKAYERRGLSKVPAQA